ncbi:MAG: universal stress protein [Kiloniellales bacterium]
MFNSILVCIDGSEHANRAIDLACELAKNQSTKLTLLHVITKPGGQHVPEALKSLQEIEHVHITERDVVESVGRDVLEAASQRVRKGGVGDCDTLLEVGDAAGTIVETAKSSGADLIVMGRRGLGDFTGLLLGSVSHKVAQAADCSCLTVK